jgi:ABC-type glycerol-3-phosphate transport system substrate-binding protein
LRPGQLTNEEAEMKGQMTRRDVLKGLGLAAGASLLGACAAGGTPQVVKETVVVQASPEVVKETVVVEKVVTPTPVGGPEATVRVFDYDPTGTDAWVQADKDFELYFTAKYPHIKVIREQAPWAGFTEKLLTSIAGGSRYDVIYGYWEWLPQFIENNVVSPLDDMIQADPEIDPGDFYDYAKEVVDGKTYGLAWFISGWLHWYNKTRVQEKGATLPKDMDKEGKWDYPAWYQFAKDFTYEEEGKRIFGYDMSSTRHPTVYCMLAWAHGTDLWEPDFSRCVMDSAENLEVWKFIQQFYAEHLTPLPGEGGTGEQAIGYTNGRVTATMAGQWYTRSIVQEGAPNLFEIGMVRFPKGPKGQFSVAALNSFYFGSKPEYPEAAWTWYKERSFSEAAAKIYASIGGGRFPSRKSVAPQTVYAWEDTEVYEAIRPILRPYRVSPKESEFIPLFNAAWDEMVLQSRPVEEILSQLATEATQLLS